MGTWGTSPWDSDDAADWFSEFFDGVDVDARIASALEYDDDYGQIRAACYMLTMIGRTYVWPGDLENLEMLLDLGIQRLQDMLDEDSEFRELWEDDEEVIEAVTNELASLKDRRSEITDTAEDTDKG